MSDTHGMARVRLLAKHERADFAEMLAGLNAEQWCQPSLCHGWSVRDVVAHTVAYLAQSRSRLAVNLFHAQGHVDRLNAQGLTSFKSVGPLQLVELMRRGIEPTGAGALYGGRVALIECLVHQQDIRRPLGLPRSIPEDRLRAALSYARISPVIAGGWKTRGLRLTATDIDWSTGRGPRTPRHRREPLTGHDRARRSSAQRVRG
ncbi:uncharacterized protein (TIGR03083 family) [Mycobacterium sp. BK086]|uniref:maleylpyruvate isomerase family mycothiol-dependent enzyme n=1 Tax=Mycobacterium sp. BK086 TaxID=2512165 RepID=UPI0010EB4849|nr:uncharacterized protein (TIGR03083 family) [Mycobacterium sp. BK086]